MHNRSGPHVEAHIPGKLATDAFNKRKSATCCDKAAHLMSTSPGTTAFLNMEEMHSIFCSSSKPAPWGLLSIQGRCKSPQTGSQISMHKPKHWRAECPIAQQQWSPHLSCEYLQFNSHFESSIPRLLNLLPLLLPQAVSHISSWSVPVNRKLCVMALMTTCSVSRLCLGLACCAWLAAKEATSALTCNEEVPSMLLD